MTAAQVQPGGVTGFVFGMVLGGLIGIVATATVGVLAVSSSVGLSWQREAVRKGAAVYVTQEDGTSQWAWKVDANGETAANNLE